MLKRVLSWWLPVLVVFAVFGGSVQAAGSYPATGLKIICPFGNGGDTDFNTRLLGAFLHRQLQLPVKVENILGDNGIVAMDEFSTAPADGAHLMVAHTSMLFFNEVSGMSSYNLDSFELVAAFAQGSGEVLLVPADSPFKTLADLLNAAREHPGKISFGTSMGSDSYIFSQIVEQQRQAVFQLKDAPDSLTRLAMVLDGLVDAGMSNYRISRSAIEQGRLRALAINTEERSPEIPDLPTFKEQGVADFSANLVYLLFAPKGTPDELLEQLNAAVREFSAHNEEYRQRSRNYNFNEPLVLNRAQSVGIARHIRGHVQRLRSYIH